MTLIEDTSPGAHDTLTAACDASQYAALGVDKPAEHGSCAENLVLALKQLNENAGLKGTKAVGADITVNIAPTPLHLFMNAPIEIKSDGEDGSGASGAKLKVEEPKGKKRSYVRFRAERDIVVIMSACPMDIGKQNGGKIMAANYMVEEANEEDAPASKTSKTNEKSSVEKGKETPKKSDAGGKEEKPAQPKAMPKPRGGPAKIQGVQKSAQDAKKSSTVKEEPEQEPESEPSKAEDKSKPKPMPKPRGGPAKIQAVQKSAQDARKNSAVEKPEPESEPPKKEEKTASQATDSKAEEPKSEEPPKEKKKPKKLVRRTGTATPAKSEES